MNNGLGWYCSNLTSVVFLFFCFFVFFSADIDECTEPSHGCSQLCNNTLGSYNCFCLKGYWLQKDNKTCVGRLSSKIRSHALPWARLLDFCEPLIRFMSKLIHSFLTRVQVNYQIKLPKYNSLLRACRSNMHGHWPRSYSINGVAMFYYEL